MPREKSRTGEKYRTLESVFSEQLSDAGQVACVTSMLPKWAQEYMHLHAQDSWNLDVLTERTRLVCDSRARGLMPVDVGAVEEEGWGEHGKCSQSISIPTATGVRGGDTWQGCVRRHQGWRREERTEATMGKAPRATRAERASRRFKDPARRGKGNSSG